MGTRYITVDQVPELLAQNPFRRSSTAWCVWQDGAMVGVNRDHQAGIDVFQKLAKDAVAGTESWSVRNDLRDDYALGLAAGKAFPAPALDAPKPFTVGNGRYQTDQYDMSDQQADEIRAEMAESRRYGYGYRNEFGNY